jgi:drug/metabolite transporter (DMT)-like permease
MLLGTTLFWGLSLPLIKNWQNAAGAGRFPGGEFVASLTLIALRMLPAAVVLVAFQPRLLSGPSRREWAVGSLVGLVSLFGIVLQVWGLADTTPALSGFFTSVASAWVPLLAFIFFRTRVSRLTLVGMSVGISGAAVLGFRPGAWQLGTGEWLTVAGSVLLAVDILLLDRLGRDARPGHLTLGFLLGHAVPALLVVGGMAAAHPWGANWVRATAGLLCNSSVLLDMALLTLTTALAYHWMATYQPRVPASRAALVFLLEPVFGAVFSVAWGHDRLTLPLLLGGCLLLGGNLLVELPGWLRQGRVDESPTDRTVSPPTDLFATPLTAR